MDLDSDFLRHGLIIYVLLVASVVIHEWGHAIAAHLLGDDSPRAEGRLTLDPRPHFDLIGTLLLPLISIFGLGTGFLTYGWGRPVFTNPANFRHRVRDDILVSLAGPVANLLLALVATVLGCLVIPAAPIFSELVSILVLMNVWLAVVNLLPVPPFDGGSILFRRVIGVSDETYLTLSRWSWPVLLLLSRVPLWNYLLGSAYVDMLKPFAAVCNAISPAARQLIFNL